MSNLIERELRRICNAAYKEVNPIIGNRNIVGKAVDGDVYFELDKLAEDAVKKACSKSDLRLAYFSEGSGNLEILHSNPDYIIMCDEIDGSRGAKSGFENCCVTIALAPRTNNPKVKNVQYAFIKEIKDGVEFFAEKNKGVKIYSGGKYFVPQPSKVTSLEKASLSIELWGEPLIATYVTDPILLKSLGVGIFHVNSSSWSNCQIVRGRLDGYFHLAKRIYDEFPEFRNITAPAGKLKGLFPYDIAPWYLLDVEAGVAVSDSYGNSLADMKLLDISPGNQRCAISASTPQLYDQLSNVVNERFENLHKKENLEFLRNSFATLKL